MNQPSQFDHMGNPIPERTAGPVGTQPRKASCHPSEGANPQPQKAFCHPSEGANSQPRKASCHPSEGANPQPQKASCRPSEGANSQVRKAFSRPKKGIAVETAAPMGEEQELIDATEDVIEVKAVRKRKPMQPPKKRDVLKIYLFTGLLLILFVVGLLFFLRPTVSDEEKRELTKFPKLTWDSFITGDYFKQISLWYADTYPGRDVFISMNQALKNLYGIRKNQIIQNPTGPTDPDRPQNPEIPDLPDDGSPVERFDKVYVKGDRAFEIYKFNRSNSERYCQIINAAAQRLDGIEVFNLIAPLSYSVNLSEKEQKSIGASDVGEAIDFMYENISSQVHTVRVLSGLMQHRDEELYFRTDHHWTARGAYYAYVEFCHAAGETPKPLDTWEKKEFGGFLGTLYQSAGQPDRLGDRPDTVEAWIPNATNKMTVYDGKNKIHTEYPIIQKATDSYYQNAASKYNCFIAGDHPLTVIENPHPETANGKSIIVVKESYGNAFVPFLVDHYQTVYVIDYRYFESKMGQNLIEFAKEKNVDQVLFLNYIYATAEGRRLGELSSLVGGVA